MWHTNRRRKIQFYIKMVVPLAIARQSYIASIQVVSFLISHAVLMHRHKHSLFVITCECKRRGGGVKASIHVHNAPLMVQTIIIEQKYESFRCVLQMHLVSACIWKLPKRGKIRDIHSPPYFLLERVVVIIRWSAIACIATAETLPGYLRTVCVCASVCACVYIPIYCIICTRSPTWSTPFPGPSLLPPSQPPAFSCLLLVGKQLLTMLRAMYPIKLLFCLRIERKEKPKHLWKQNKEKKRNVVYEMLCRWVLVAHQC